MSGGSQATDLNADGLTDLIIIAHAVVEPPNPSEYAQTVVYRIRGNAARLTGRYQPQPEHRYHPISYTAPEPLETGLFSFIDGRSDFDGDGSSDLLMVYGEDKGSNVLVTEYVLPGSSRAPD